MAPVLQRFLLTTGEAMRVVAAIIFLINCGLFECWSFAAPASQEVSPQEDTYNFGSELMKQILGSVRRDKFNLALSFGLLIPGKEQTLPALVDEFNLRAIMLFNGDSKGVVVSVFPPKLKASPEEKKLEVQARIDLHKKYAVVHMQRGERENELVGKLRFYTKNNEGQLVPDSIKIELSSDLLEFKKLLLFGATLRIQWPGSKSSKEEIKNGLMKSLVECDAEVESTDVIRGGLNHGPLEKCSFSFEGDDVRVQYREPTLTVVP